MEHVEYFKLQSKNLLRDYKTRIFNETEEFYDYQPKYFDIDRIFLDFDLPDYKKDFKFRQLFYLAFFHYYYPFYFYYNQHI